MDIAETKEGIDGVIRKWVNALKFNNSPVVQLGTSSFKSQQYFSDYDLFSPVNDRNITPENSCKELHKIFKRLKPLDNIWFIELKIQNRDGSKAKFYEPDIDCSRFVKEVKTLDYLKFDFVVYIKETGKLTELSMIYSFSDMPPLEDLIKTIQTDYDYYKGEGNLYKSLKRAFSVYRLRGDKEKMVEISEIFNSRTGLLYTISSNLKAIKLILDGGVKGDNIENKVRVNLQDISNDIDMPLKTEKDIDSAIKTLDSLILNQTKEWLKSHKSVLLKK
jgi:hypothetical protein|nr:MAG: hypothetical protein [Lake Baikal virophage 1]